MVLYSAALTIALVVSSPWWLLRMATTERYREGLRQRLGFLPGTLLEALGLELALEQIVWVHAVSVGEVLAATRLVPELEAALGEDWAVVVSTTTRTGQALARERFGPERVFYMPLDFAWPVRRYLRVLKPKMLVLMESELWPRMLHECKRRGVLVAVVNARVSDRSFARAMKVRSVWGRVLRMVPLWLAQSEEDARRLVAMGADAATVRAIGNLKYDVRAGKESRVAGMIREAANGRPIVVAGSTVADAKGVRGEWEEELVIQAWADAARKMEALLVVAPRHPERFADAAMRTSEFASVRASSWAYADPTHRDPTAMDGPPDAPVYPPLKKDLVEIILLDTIGDLATVYSIADVAFVGGSLVNRGGHNPLEPAQFGVPVIMGPNFQNFRAIVSTMQKADGIRIVADVDELRQSLIQMLTDRPFAQAMGRRGQQVFEEQQGATARAVTALVSRLQGEQE